MIQQSQKDECEGVYVPTKTGACYHTQHYVAKRSDTS